MNTFITLHTVHAHVTHFNCFNSIFSESEKFTTKKFVVMYVH